MWTDRRNEAASEIQRALGVDPERCMKLRIAKLSGYNNEAQIVSGAAEGVWLTSRFGSAKRHDIKYHAASVEQLHPEVVDIIKQVAVILQDPGIEVPRRGIEEYALTLDIGLDSISDINFHRTADTMFRIAKDIPFVEGVPCRGKALDAMSTHLAHVQTEHSIAYVAMLNG